MSIVVVVKKGKHVVIASDTLTSAGQIKWSSLKIHKLLKDDYYLVSTQKSGEQTVEATKLKLLIANSSGIYEIGHDRHIGELTKFWAIGSGGSFALGAMHYAYDKKKYSAEDIARIGVESACEFDKSCALPMDLQVIKLKM